MFAAAAMVGLPAVLLTPIDTIVSAFITVMVAGCLNAMRAADGERSSTLWVSTLPLYLIRTGGGGSLSPPATAQPCNRGGNHLRRQAPEDRRRPRFRRIRTRLALLSSSTRLPRR